MAAVPDVVDALVSGRGSRNLSDGSPRRIGGPPPVMRGEALTAMLGLVGSRNHLILAEIAACPAETQGVQVHLTTMHRSLHLVGWNGRGL